MTSPISTGSGRAPGLIVRAAQEEDGPALTTFRCATGPWFEQEVEDFIHTHALTLALSAEGLYRLLLVVEDDRLVGCAGHHLEGIVRGDGKLLMATRLQLLALSRTDQGRRLDDGRRLSDLVMETVKFDALETRAGRVLTAIVARDNIRSIRLAERHGLRSQVRYDSRHVRLSGLFRRSD